MAIYLFEINFNISLDDASAMTANFRANNPNPNGVIGGLFSADSIQDILDQDGCESVRFYFAVDPNGPGDITIVLTGVDGDGNDMYNGVLRERSIACPPMCSESNPLNTTS